MIFNVKKVFFVLLIHSSFSFFNDLASLQEIVENPLTQKVELMLATSKKLSSLAWTNS
jgi:hypothetical protein